MINPTTRNKDNDKLEAEARRRYQEQYSNNLYRRATKGHSVQYNNALIDAALWRCGSPYFLELPEQDWDDKALDFLDEFVFADSPAAISFCDGCKHWIHEDKQLTHVHNVGWICYRCAAE